MTVPARPLLDDAARQLAEAGIESAQHDALALLGHVLGVARMTASLVEQVDDAQATELRELVGRRASREPLQHLTGVAGFRYVELAVGPGVFVPRPETELLAGWAVGRAREVAAAGREPTVVDLGTGSGAIALAVAAEVPEARVHAVEVSEEALAWADRNLAGAGVDLRHGGMADAYPDLDGTVDVVVSNPPYIPLKAFESVRPEVRDHDPGTALWSGEDGLDAMRVVERVAARLLVPAGVVGAERADVQGESAPAVFASAGRWTDVRDHLDLAGRARFVTARLAR